MNIPSKQKKLIALLTILTCSLYSSISDQLYAAAPLKDASTTIEILPSKCETLTRDEVKEIIKEYIDTNPDAILNSISKVIGLEKEQKLEPATLLKADIEQIYALYKLYNFPSIGNQDGKVLINVFYDYCCPYSKQFNSVINNLVDSNDDIKIIYLPVPFVNAESTYAAGIALAVNEIDPSKFSEFHNKMLSLESITRKSIKDVLVEIGITDIDNVEAVRDSAATNQMFKVIEVLTGKINLKAVPAVIVGNELRQGLIPINQLQEKIQKMLQEGSIELEEPQE